VKSHAVRTSEQKGKTMGSNTSAFRRTLRQVGPLTATAALVATTVVAGAGPAAAMHPTGDQSSPLACEIFADLNANEVYVAGARERMCGGDPEDTIPLTTVILKRVGGVWKEVARGLGGARYNCKGSTRSTYKLQNTSLQATVNCS
jgi:hypothetical protein